MEEDVHRNSKADISSLPKESQLGSQKAKLGRKEMEGRGEGEEEEQTLAPLN